MVVTRDCAGDRDCAARFFAKPAISHCLASFYFGPDAAILVTRQAEPEKRLIFLYSLALVTREYTAGWHGKQQLRADYQLFRHYCFT